MTNIEYMTRLRRHGFTVHKIIAATEIRSLILQGRDGSHVMAHHPDDLSPEERARELGFFFSIHGGG